MSNLISRCGTSRTAPLVALVTAIALLVMSPAPACAADGGAAAGAQCSARPLLLAESGGWSISTFFASLNNRTRIIQFCTIVMCLALYILMRKFTPQRS